MVCSLRPHRELNFRGKPVPDHPDTWGAGASRGRVLCRHSSLNSGRLQLTHQRSYQSKSLRRSFSKARTRNTVKSRGLFRLGGRHDSKETFGFVRAYQANYSVTLLCRVLKVSVSGFYAWCSRAPSQRTLANIALGDKIEAAYRKSRSSYRRPRIKAELQDEGVRAGDKRIARLMRERGCYGISRRRSTTTTIRDRDARPAPDLVDRNFTAAAPDQLWVADITYVPTWSGFLYLAVVLDVFSRRIVGWSMANHMRKELVLDALDMAIFRRQPRGVVHHSDQGPQYMSIAFGMRCKKAGILPSMGSIGDCYDNAMCESFNATLECELLARHRFKTHVRHRARSSTSSKAGIIGIVGTRHSAIFHQTTTNAG